MYKTPMEASSQISHVCLVKFQFVYSELKSAERKAADFCLANPEIVTSSTITEVSERAGCSEATLVRLAKRLGYNGYPELRVALLREDTEEIAQSIGVQAGDDLHSIARGVFNASIVSLNDSLDSLDFNCLENVITALLQAKHILFCAAGDANIVALSGVQKFIRMGLPVSYNADYDAQLISLSHMDENDVLICISHSGRTKNICEFAKVAHNKKVRVISLTNFPQSPLAKVSDIVLLTASFAYDMMGEILAKRVPALCIMDVIYVSLLMLLDDKQRNILDEGNKMLRINKL